MECEQKQSKRGFYKLKFPLGKYNYYIDKVKINTLERLKRFCFSDKTNICGMISKIFTNTVLKKIFESII